MWNIVTTAIVSENGTIIGEKFWKYPAFVVLRLCDIVVWTEDEHILLSGVTMKVKIDIYVMRL